MALLTVENVGVRFGGVVALDGLSFTVDEGSICALISGPTGIEAIERILADAPAWLTGGGSLVLEIGETQGRAVTTLAHDAGFEDVTIHPDLAGRDRYLVAR